MKNIRLTRNGSGREVLVNWSNVDFVNDTVSHFGDGYTEVHCGDSSIDVKESLEEIESLLNNATK